MDLFEERRGGGTERVPPLAARMRPVSVEDIVGQDHLLGPGRLLRRAIDADRLSSMIFYGPPGCGKTSLAEVIASATHRAFVRASGVTSNVAAIRDRVEEARTRHRVDGRETILFIDEIHRFSKSQQDVLLPHVEDGTVVLVGATTHNPQVFVNAPLTSRSLLFELRPLTEEAVVELLRRALASERGLAALPVDADADALRHIARICEGDARRALNALEIAVLSTPKDSGGRIGLTAAVAEDSIQKKIVVYDRDEDGHYDTISAFIKSVRGSDPHAAVYWLAKMLVAGEDPRFIARRLVILASEDIGNADPRGLTVAVAAMQASEFVGMPEARIILSQATTYLATAPKSNASYMAVDKAMADVEQGRVLPVPRHLRNLKARRDGEATEDASYKYPHDFAGQFVEQEYVPTSAVYYAPAGQGYEDTIARRMADWSAKRRPSAGDAGKAQGA
jgi:putative ATPase